MKRLMILVVLVAALGLQANTAESADASSAWNQFAASYHFNQSWGGAMGSTFAQNYHGENFSADFGAILSNVAQVMGTGIPPFSDDDVMSTSLTDWPDP